MTPLNIALPKGRLGESVCRAFVRAGLIGPDALSDSRRLIFLSRDGAYRLFWVKPSDVGVYVERGAADIGVAGKDILLEYRPEVYELMDLRAGICRMAVAGRADFRDDRSRPLRVATKYPRIAAAHYREKSREIDVIRLGGSIELAPLLDLSDVIVDIVETGATLRENGLKELETVAEISARLAANKASYEFRREQIDLVCARLREGMEGNP